MKAEVKMIFYTVILAVSIIIVLSPLILKDDLGAKMSGITLGTKKIDSEVTAWKGAPNYDVIPKSAATKEEVDLSEKLAKYIKGARAVGVSGIILKEEHSDSGLLLSLIIQNTSKSDSFLVSVNGESIVFGWEKMEVKVRESRVCEAIITSDESRKILGVSKVSSEIKGAEVSVENMDKSGLFYAIVTGRKVGFVFDENCCAIKVYDSGILSIDSDEESDLLMRFFRING